MIKKFLSGMVHKVPADLKKSLMSSQKALDAWNTLTPLARNEWICWVTSVTRPETRKKHIERLHADLLNGKRRPCCWYGCIHRKDKAISPSIQGLIKKRGLK